MDAETKRSVTGLVSVPPSLQTTKQRIHVWASPRYKDSNTIQLNKWRIRERCSFEDRTSNGWARISKSWTIYCRAVFNGALSIIWNSSRAHTYFQVYSASVKCWCIPSLTGGGSSIIGQRLNPVQPIRIVWKVRQLICENPIYGTTTCTQKSTLSVVGDGK